MQISKAATVAVLQDMQQVQTNKAQCKQLSLLLTTLVETATVHSSTQRRVQRESIHQSCCCFNPKGNLAKNKRPGKSSCVVLGMQLIPAALQQPMTGGSHTRRMQDAAVLNQRA
jgi:hypothetical protein